MTTSWGWYHDIMMTSQRESTLMLSGHRVSGIPPLKQFQFTIPHFTPSPYLADGAGSWALPDNYVVIHQSIEVGETVRCGTYIVNNQIK